VSIFSEMDDIARVRGHLAHWRRQLAVAQHEDDAFSRMQAQGIVNTLERREAELQAQPPAPAAAWNTGHKDIPTDRPVWAYVYVGTSSDEEPVLLLRGVSDGDGGGFTIDYEGRPWDRDGHVISWIDVEQRPTLSVEAVDAIAAALIDYSIHWYCIDHIVEDWLHREALWAVVDGHPDAQAIAADALRTRELKFSRYYG